jgi:hypothetical protein
MSKIGLRPRKYSESVGEKTYLAFFYHKVKVNESAEMKKVLSSFDEKVHIKSANDEKEREELTNTDN